jgi:hypothetical protein
MTIRIDRRDRVFQLWSYTVSMGRLLLRSTKSDQFETRVDVAFQNVQAVQLPTLLPGLAVSEADTAETERIVKETGLLPDDDRKFFSVIGSNFTGYVVAGVVVSCEDSGEYYEPSQVWPDGPGHLS